MPQDFFACLQSGKAFEPNCSALAKKYNWGEYERKGTEETWGFWLKEQHLEEKEITIPAAIADFETEFISPFKYKASKDQLVQNPYFYVLKGNDHLTIGGLSYAIACYNRSIAMDPTFSVNARYNKAQALLLYAKNAGPRQQLALQELKIAKEIIVGTYRPALITFNTLISQNGSKIKTSQHVQNQLDVLSEQENHIVMACDIIATAQLKKHHVKLTPKSLKEAFEKEEVNHDKAIREATVNGLTNFFTVEEVIPTPWWSIVSVALIGLAQMAAGFMIVACTAGALGSGLISEGISDLITAVKSAITGSFSWAAWAIQKAISIAVSLISAGYGALKSGWQSATNTVKDLVGKTAVGASQSGINLAIKETAMAVGKGAAKE